jgi:hypothetical protein
MANVLVRVSPARSQVVHVEVKLLELVERAGEAARFAWEEFFFAEHHNLHTQKAYESAVRRLRAWAEGQGVELSSNSPGMLGQYLTGLGGSAAKRRLRDAGLSLRLSPHSFRVTAICLKVNGIGTKQLLREDPAANNRWLPRRRCPWPDRAGPRRGATRKEANGPRLGRRRHRRNQTEEWRSGGPSPAVAGLQAR